MTQFLGIQTIAANVPASFATGSQGLSGLLIGNESGLSVTIDLDGGGFSKSLYPGTVDYFPIRSGYTGTVKAKSTALLNNVSNWPSSFLQFDAVGINEQINVNVYPLALPRTVTSTGSVTTTGNTLSNEGNPDGQEIIDIGTESNNKLIDIFNEHFIWSVEQSDIAHQVLKGQNAGNPLQIGQAGDIVEVLGQLLIDQVATFLNNISLQWQDSGGIARLALKLNATNQLVHASGAVNAAHIFQDSAGTGLMSCDNTNVSILGKKINDASGNNLADWSATGCFLKGNAGSHGGFGYQSVNGNTDWTMQAISIVSFNSVNGTTAAINHNLKVNGAGVTPDIIVGNAFNTGVSASNVTLGFSEVGSTTFKASSIAAVACKALCMKL